MINEYAGGAADLEARYRLLSDDELLQLSIDGGLVSEAGSALQAEMLRRSLGTRDVEDLKGWEEEQRLSRTPPQRVFLGYGIRFVGHKYLSADDQLKGIFVATKFIVWGWLSIIPIGSYRVDRGDQNVPLIQSRVSLQWDQVWSGVKWPLLQVAIGVALATVVVFSDNRK